MEVEGNRWPASASLPRRVVVEGIGTAFLLSTVVGSGIWASDSSAGTRA